MKRNYNWLQERIFRNVPCNPIILYFYILSNLLYTEYTLQRFAISFLVQKKHNSKTETYYQSYQHREYDWQLRLIILQFSVKNHLFNICILCEVMAIIQMQFVISEKTGSLAWWWNKLNTIQCKLVLSEYWQNSLYII